MQLIPGFGTGFFVVLTVALLPLVAVLATMATQFFARNRRERIATQQPLVRYYSHLVTAH